MKDTYRKEEYKELLEEFLLECEEEGSCGIIEGESDEIIYQIDDINIYGDFDYGARGVDHNILLFDDYSWEEIISYGTLVVPETESYISEEEIELFESLGYERLPLEDKHIMGYQYDEEMEL